MFKLLRPLSDVASGVWTLTRVIELLGADLANADDPFARAKGGQWCGASVTLMLMSDAIAHSSLGTIATGTLAAIVESSPEAVDTSQCMLAVRVVDLICVRGPVTTCAHHFPSSPRALALLLRTSSRPAECG